MREIEYIQAQFSFFFSSRSFLCCVLGKVVGDGNMTCSCYLAYCVHFNEFLNTQRCKSHGKINIQHRPSATGIAFDHQQKGLVNLIHWRHNSCIKMIKAIHYAETETSIFLLKNNVSHTSLQD